MKNWILLILLISFSAHQSFGQLIDPFAIRYQTNQKGGLKFLANTSVGCNCAANSEIPPGGTGDNNNFSMTFVDIDSDASTYMSSSDQLSLAACSEVLWAGLYWTGNLENTPSSTPNWASRAQVKFKVGTGAYTTLLADELLDNTVGKVSYFCFKDITSIVQANPLNANYTVGNVVTKTGTNTYGGWTIVVVYNNVYESMKNLTVFDGLANVSSGAAGTVNIPISGFLTPPTGAVNFELGVVAHDGDRGQTGDQLQFNGAGTYVNISDALHAVNNVFNSTISNNGVLTPFRVPSYNNNLGHDANIYVPNNSTFNYIGNSATNASIRVSTTSETVLTSVITSAIDIYVPDLRASVSYNDLNGGTVLPGDILEYTIVSKNIGSDVSINTILTDTLDNRLTYLPGTMNITYGPNSGLKTDLVDTDQAEFLSANNVIRARIGTGANGTIGGAVVNSPTGADSTVLKFQVQLTNDCAVWQCGSILENRAFLFGTGQISGIQNGNNGASDQLDVNGCPSIESGVVTVDVSQCQDTVITFTDSLCVGETLLLNFPNSTYLTYQWTGPNGFTATINNPTLPNVQLVNGGDYVLHVYYDGLECITDTTAPVFVSDNPTLNLNYIVDDSCFNAGTGAINVSGIGNAPFTYTWSNGDLDSLANSLGAGTYSVFAEDQYGCSVADTFSITEPTPLTGTTSILSNYNGQQISCYDAMDGSAGVVASGGTLPYTYLWTPSNITTATAVNLDAGTHVIQVTDDKGCIYLDSVTLVQPDSIIITPTITNVGCFGDSTGAIDVTITGGTMPYAYSWSNLQTTEDLTNLPVGFYTDTLVDINGCSDTVTFQVTEPVGPLSMTSTVNPVVCFGEANGSIELIVSGGTAPYTYNWSNGDPDSLAGNLASGTYTVEVVDQNGCNLLDTFTLVDPPVMTVTASITSDYNGQDISCFNAMDGSADVVVTGGEGAYTYLWTPTLSTNPAISGLDAGMHVIAVTDSLGCVKMDSVLLIEPDTLTISAVVTNVLCFSYTTGAINATIQGGTLPYSYSWSNTAITEDILNLPAGVYTDTVTDFNGCMSVESFTITEPSDSMTLTATSTGTLCFGDPTGTINLTVTGGNPAYTYLWSNSAVSQDLTGIVGGNYTVDVTDANNCVQSQTIYVYTPDEIVLTETHINPVCQSGTQGSIDLSVTGGTPGFTYAWNNGELTQDIVGLYAGIYFVGATDANGCVDTLTIVLTDPDAVLIDEVHTDVLCYGDSTAMIDITPSNGTPAYTYNWGNGATTQDISGLPAGLYWLDVIDLNGCGGFQSIWITQPDTALHLVSSQATNILCFGASTGAINITIAGGTAPYTYLWSNSAVTQDLSGLPIGIYSVVVTDNNGCQISFSDTLTEPTDLVLSETNVDVLCFGQATGSVDVTVSGGVGSYSYSWNPNVATTQDLTSILAGTYTLTVTDGNGCTETISSEITQPASAINLATDPDAVLCNGGGDGSIDLDVSGGTAGYTYLWSNGGTTQDITGLEVGSYSVTVTDANGCIATLVTAVGGPPEPLTLITTADPICFGDSIGVVSVLAYGGTPGYTYQWDTSIDDTLSLVSGLPIGIYGITVTDANGCTSSTFADLQILPDGSGCVVIDMPNVFTPNGDGTNDFFIPRIVESVAEYEITIVNRWGNKVFQSDDYTMGWDGLTQNGTEANEGVYFWIIQYTDVYENEGNKQGNLTLIRSN